jgi:enolase
MSVAIQKVQALEILDSRGNPTLGVELTTTGGQRGATIQVAIIY